MRIAALILVAALAAGCGADASPNKVDDPPVDRASLVPDARNQPGATIASQDAIATKKLVVDTAPRRARGVDVSHHQGAIDWQAVRTDGIEFAYLKATEGTTYVDPTYADHRVRAREAGLMVGSYHFFSQCGEGLPQAQHFVDVIGAQRDRTALLAPAVDLELDPNCTDEPTRAVMLREVRAFIGEVEARTDRQVVVYAFPSFEQQYRLAGDLERRLWVRDLAGEPRGDWWIWQRSQTAEVNGIATPVDLNILRH